MKIENKIKRSFSVIGKEGTTYDGQNFIKKLWEEANEHFNEISDLAKKNEDGKLIGIWGAMSDLSRSYQPWENNFTEGLYLAGVECYDEAKAPSGWTKWTIPSYEYLVVECDEGDTFSKMIHYLKQNDLHLVGAVHDYTDPSTKKNYMFFPIKKVD